MAAGSANTGSGRPHRVVQNPGNAPGERYVRKRLRRSVETTARYAATPGFSGIKLPEPGVLAPVPRLPVLPGALRPTEPLAAGKGDAEKFRLSSWVNSISLIVQDKRGANIPVLIFQALFLLYDGRFDDFDNRVEALRKYRQRNLAPESEHFRTDCFIRLLENVTKYGYRHQAVEKAAVPLLEKLHSVSNDLLDRSFEIEVVPYERQWEWVRDIMKMHDL